MFYLEAILDSSCLENTAFDLAYMTELDPTWHDDELSRILGPEAYLFGNLIAQAACAADCITATMGFPNNTFFWCAGCLGNLYPLNGNVQSHVGGVQVSSLITNRLIAKMHREGLMWAASGDEGLCGYYPQLVMDKTIYKYNMLYPIPQGKQLSNLKETPSGFEAETEGSRCCQPLGRSTILWGAGKEYPFEGEDFSYEIFRKRNCCE
jgi:conjugal transfer pilus assembly protein TraU